MLNTCVIQRAAIIVSIILLVGCGGPGKPTLSHMLNVEALSAHDFYVKCYQIPKGVFRGVLWPTDRADYFKLWVIRKTNEAFYEVSAPSGFIFDKKSVSDQWLIKCTDRTDNITTYTAARKDGSALFRFQLPTKKTEYSFTVFRNNSSEEMLIFMDIHETNIDIGTFGYIIIKTR